MKMLAIVPVIMCNWRRTHRLPATLRQLASQRGIKIKLYIWNNNTDDQKLVDKYVAEHPDGLEVEVHHHHKNIGGFGRFYYAKELAATYPFVIFIDDDQELMPDTIATFAREFEPATIKGQHAFNFANPDNYWLRLPARRGQRATYIGTCGMVAESSIFTQDELFECPKEFWFIEDLWLCYVAEHKLGWQLTRSHARMRFVMDTKNQFSGLVAKKSEFLRYLTDTGWKIQGRLWGQPKTPRHIS